MRKLLGSILLAAALRPLPAPGADAPSLFAPEPPDPAAAALVEAYVPLLAAGRFEDALALNDLRGIRQYLLDRRLADLKARNPELTSQDLEQLSAQLQLNELNPARLKEIIIGMMQEAAYEGMTWRIRGYAPAPGTAAGDHLVGIDARTAEGKEKPILLGIRKLGEEWKIAPEIIEIVGSRQAAVHLVPRTEIPEAVRQAVQAFWKHWREGELNKAHALLSPAYQARVPLLVFLGQAQDFNAQTGVPSGWQIVQGATPAPAALAVGVNVQGERATRPTLMLFKRVGKTWVLEDLQLEMPRSATPAPGAAESAPSFRPDLTPDLKPDLGPVLPPAGPQTPAPAP